MRLIVTALVLTIMAGCGASDPAAPAKEAIKATLNDPDSAQFKDITLCPSGEGVAGKFNAKNIMGGYTKFASFFFVRDKLYTFDDGNFTAGLKACYPDYEPTGDLEEPENMETLSENGF